MSDKRLFQKRKSFDKQTKHVKRNQSKSPVKQIKADEEDEFLGDAHIKVVIRGKEADYEKKFSEECDEDLSLGTNLSSEESYQQNLSPFTELFGNEYFWLYKCSMQIILTLFGQI